jgi:beta-aspartyl-peptidase (threonine type)
MAKTALDLLKDEAGPQAAANQAIALLAQKIGGIAGLIMIDRQGRIGYARNTERMPVGFILSDGQVRLDS